MPPVVQAFMTDIAPEGLAARFVGEPGLVLLRGGLPDATQSRYSFVAARPFLVFRAFGSRCEIDLPDESPSSRPAELVARPLPDRFGNRAEVRAANSVRHVRFGNPWRLLDELMGRYELVDEVDLPFPLGGGFGFWGYDLKNFVEPKLPRRAMRDLELPDCHVGFYDSLVAFDHQLGRTWIVATGLSADGTRCAARAAKQIEFWQRVLENSRGNPLDFEALPRSCAAVRQGGGIPRAAGTPFRSNLSRAEYVARVEQAQRYIRAGDIYQVNLSQRLAAPLPGTAWELFARLSAVSPAPYAAFLDCGEFQLVSSSPELFLRLSGSHILTRPIKGTRPRGRTADEDARLAYELQTSAKENAELVMITDLLRNDLGRVCEFGSVQVPDLMRLERYAQVQHLVSTVEGRLRPDVTHLAALAACFPGGSITGAPKFRAMEIIDELEPTARGPFTGALGWLGFNRESRLSIIIRTAICLGRTAYFPVGAGIVADSVPEAEYEETLAKAGGFVAALERAHAARAETPGSAAAPAPAQTDSRA